MHGEVRATYVDTFTLERYTMKRELTNVTNLSKPSLTTPKTLSLGPEPKKVGGLRVDQAATPEKLLGKGFRRVV